MPPPHEARYPARLPDGRILFLPIRTLDRTGLGIASLILSQSSFEVESTLADFLTDRLKSTEPDVIVGMPTLGLSLARAVAERLGHSRYVALGTSRKFWYDEALSVSLSSVTSPGQRKHLYLDPRMLPLLQGTRACLIDDVISSGRSITAGLELLRTAGIRPVAIGAAMLQTRRWIAPLNETQPAFAQIVQGVIETPLLRATGSGWQPDY